MRVIAGSVRGHRLQNVSGRAVRPTADRVKEAMFSMLTDVRGDSVVDFFAGSGALGIEALSRGAASCLFVDRARRSCAMVERNLAHCHLEAEVRCTDAMNIAGPFDLALVDPPYVLAPEPFIGAHLVAPGGRVVIEHEARRAITVPDGYELDRTRKYGDSALTLLWRVRDGEDAQAQ